MTAEQQRYWINWTLPGDTTRHEPFGDDTCEIVDEREGGVIVYTHRHFVSDVLTALRKADDSHYCPECWFDYNNPHEGCDACEDRKPPIPDSLTK